MTKITWKQKCENCKEYFLNTNLQRRLCKDCAKKLYNSTRNEDDY
jgi:formylmethanofuran dehydrogenase subunit E